MAIMSEVVVVEYAVNALPKPEKTKKYGIASLMVNESLGLDLP